MNRDEKGLPEFCYVESPITGEVVLVKRGIEGYFLIDQCESAESLNIRLGITAIEIKAMTVGSMFGWGSEGADPKLCAKELEDMEPVI